MPKPHSLIKGLQDPKQMIKHQIKASPQLSSQRKKRFFEESENSSVFNENAQIPNSYEHRLQAKQLLSDVFEQDQEHQTVNIDRQHTQPTPLKAIALSSCQVLELNLRLANLKEISPELLLQNRLLRHVDLRNNKIVSLPKELFVLHHLWKLRLDYNYLQFIPSNISSLTKLEVFSASQNKIEYLPQHMFSALRQLKILVLNDNKISQVPQQMALQKQLSILLLHNNPILEIPTALSTLDNLSEFSLDWLLYQDQQRLCHKHLKGENGRVHLKEFKDFLSSFGNFIDQCNLQHFLMYIHRLPNFQDIQNIRFEQKNRTIYHQVAVAGQFYIFQDIVKAFSNAFIDLNQLDDDDSTPFILAIRNKRKDIVKYLLSLPQTNVNKASRKYGHPLLLSLQSQEFKLALSLLKGWGTDFYRPIDVQHVSEEGFNALHFLFMNFSIKPQISQEIAKQLIKKGIDLNLKNNAGHTPLHLAVTSNQQEAIIFALNFNKQSRARSSTHIFDFNARGGKHNQNVLYLAVQHNNMKVIQTLLGAEGEILDWLAVDDEGRVPKDICPYNSPAYKLLTQYEHKIIRMKGNSSSNLDQKFNHSSAVVQYYYNKRNYESPNRIRQKILENSKNQPKVQHRGRSQIQTCKNNQSSYKNPFKEIRRTPSHGRLLSCNQRSMNKEKMGLIDDIISSCDDEMSAFDMQSPISDRTSANFSMMSGVGLRQSMGKASIIPVLQKEISMELIQQPSEMIRPIHFMDAQPRLSHPLQQELDFSAHDLVIVTEDLVQKDHLYSRVYASKERILTMEKKESIMKERLSDHEDEDDDANIPEEEHQADLELQKPQIRLIKRQHSWTEQVKETNEAQTTDERLAFTKKIFEEVKRQSEKVIKMNIQNPEIAYLTIPTCEIISYVPSPNNKGTMIIQEQGNYGSSELSQVYIIQDESINIQIPFDQQQNLKVTVGLRSQNLAFSINNTRPQRSLLSFYNEIYHKACLKDFNGCLSLLESFIKEEPKQRYLSDIAYIVGSLADILKLKIIFNLSDNFDSALTKGYNQKLKTSFLFELINIHQVRVHEKQNHLKMQIISLERQRLNTQSVAVISQCNSKLSFTADSPLNYPQIKFKKPASSVIDKEPQMSIVDLVSCVNSSQIENSSTQQLTQTASIASPIMDIKHLMTQFDHSNSKGRPKLLSSSSDIFKQVKKPLEERQLEYQILHQQTPLPLCKKESLIKFQNNYEMIFQQSARVEGSKLKVIKAKVSQPTIDVNSIMFKKSSKFLHNIDQAKKQNQILSFSDSKTNNKKQFTPNASNLKMRKQDSQSRLTQTQKASVSRKQPTISAKNTPKIVRQQAATSSSFKFSQSRNETQQVFQTEESEKSSRCNQIQDDGQQKFMRSLQDASNEIRQSKLQIQVYNVEEIDHLQDNLRIKNKWNLLKQSHTAKMSAVTQNAVQRKNMFTSSQDQLSNFAYDSNKSTAKPPSSDSCLAMISQRQNPKQHHLNLSEKKGNGSSYLVLKHNMLSKQQSPKESMDMQAFKKKASVQSESIGRKKTGKSNGQI